MKNWILTIFLTFSQFISFGQNLNGTYTWRGEINDSEMDYGIVKVEITSDSTYIQTDFNGYKSEFDNRKSKWKKTTRKGQIKKEGPFYILSEFGNNKNRHLVKIKRNKMIFYGYRKRIIGKYKRVKGIELKKPAGNKM